jgi:hypothetical protein
MFDRLSWQREHRRKTHNRDIIAYPNVKIFVMKACIDTIDKQNTGAFRYHETLLDKNVDRNVLTPITQTDWQKIRVSFGFYYSRYMRRVLGWSTDLDNKRDITAFFGGRVNYDPVYHAKSISEHRKNFCDLTQKYCEISNVAVNAEKTNKISVQEYDKILRRTKIVVSPWGVGECCFRDVEAMAAGCVLIKPHSDYINTYPIGMFRNGITYVACKPDGTDLEERIGYVRDNYDEFYEMRNFARQLFYEYFDRNKQAEVLSNIVKDALK